MLCGLGCRGVLTSWCVDDGRQAPSGVLATQNGSSPGVRGVRRAGDPRSAATTRFGHAQVNGMQRSRLLTAAVSAVGEYGWEGASIERITQRAGVSRRTFYDLFRTARSACSQSWRAWSHGSRRDHRAAELAGFSWSERVRGGLWVILCFFDREPGLARVCIVESRRGDRDRASYRQRIIEAWPRLLRRAAVRAPGGENSAGGDCAGRGRWGL